MDQQPTVPSGISVPSRYEILREVVMDYPGIAASTEKLLDQLCRDERRWDVLISDLRSYGLKNFSIHHHHERGADAVGVIAGIFLEALDVPDEAIQKDAIGSLTFYIEKLLMDSGQALHRYVPVLHDCFRKLSVLPDAEFYRVVSTPHQLKKMGQLIQGQKPKGFDVEAFNEILLRSLLMTYHYWLSQQDPIIWLSQAMERAGDGDNRKELEDIFYPISHDNLRQLIDRVKRMERSPDPYSRLGDLLEFPGFIQMVRFHDDLMARLSRRGSGIENLKIRVAFLLRILDLEGLSSIHESALRETNRTLSAVIKALSVPGERELLKGILSSSFETLRGAFGKYPDACLNVLQGLGNQVYALGDSHFVEWFLQKVVSLGFQYPKVEGVTDEWQIKGNRAHLRNIRVWLDLVQHQPKWSKSLISALKIHLRLVGVQINDTDLFQKDVTRLLNSEIKPVYHFIKQLAKLFPVYFSDINAEGALRDVSVEIDDCTGRGDYLVHFLRKQAHVESSARIVEFIEAVLNFWLTKDKSPLKRFLPDEGLGLIVTSGEYFDDMHRVFLAIFTHKEFHEVQDLLTLSDKEAYEVTESVPETPKRERRRAYLAIRFYQLLHQKYSLGPEQIKTHLAQARYFGLPGADTLITALETGSLAERIEAVLDYLQLLKDIILSPEQYEAIEDVFRKRHIAAGIPSVYGRYLEKKFNALSLTYRLENLANTYFEEVVNSLNLSYITRATLFQIEKYAGLFYRALTLDGISSNRLEMTLELLTEALAVRRFSFSQYVDIFRGFSDAVQDILNTYFHSFHKSNLRQLILQMGRDNMLPKYVESLQAKSTFELVHTVSEQFLREVVTSSFGLQQLDVFFSKILKTLFMQGGELDGQELDLLMSYDPKKALSAIHKPWKITNDRIHLGNKGYNLVRLASLGIQVPAGFIVTTEVFRCLDAVTRFKYAREHLNECIEEKIGDLERQTGRTFGDPHNPLLVSVRSGSTISMPGMMSSLLNVGLNETTVEGLIRQTGKPWFAWDCYRRYLQSWAMSFGIERDKFDATMRRYKGIYHVDKKIQFTPEQMKEVAIGYRKVIIDSGIPVFDEPWMQLETAIGQVFLSWVSEKAKAYREILGISDHWGTAAIVQAMVYGNLDICSGTGVLFTSNPRETSDRVMLWGDFAVGAQGEDIVSGLVKTRPISQEQKESEVRTAERAFGEKSLEEEFPEIYESLLKISKDLIYERRWGAQEIEFTFEGDKAEDLFILQTRDMALSRKESFLAFVPSPELTESYLVSGIGAGGGVLCGKVVFDLEDIKDFRKKEPAMPLILIRSDTVPDDIRHISAADGLLTARGGATSHAAIIANRLGKTCVVGCNKIFVWEPEKRCKIKGKEVKVGDLLSIDGRNGSVYSGMHEITEIKPGE